MLASSRHKLILACMSRPLYWSAVSLKDNSAYQVKLATRKPPPTLLDADLEESFIKGKLVHNSRLTRLTIKDPDPEDRK